MTISILITSFGFLGVVLTVFFVFFQVKDPIDISKKDIGFITLWLALMILGIVNLYYVRNDIKSDEQSNSFNETDDQEVYTVNEQNNNVPQSDGEDTNLSEEELLIKQNWNLIQQLKAEYLDEDTKIIENDSVRLLFYEKAGYIYSDLKKSEKCQILNGNKVLPTKVIILDCFNDEIIYVFSSKKSNSIQYSPSNQNKFYCVAFHENYDIYVTPPIQIVGGESYNGMNITFNNKNDKYTSLFQMCAYVKNSKSDENYSICSSDYKVLLYCKNTFLDRENSSYHTNVMDSGILSFGGCSYFSLNTNYVMDLSLYHESNPDLVLSNETYSGSVTDSNIVQIHFIIDEKENTAN